MEKHSPPRPIYRAGYGMKVSHCGVRDCAFRDPSGNIVRFSQKR